ncbi:MAG: aquaporin [Saprospiraceae bacterium]
MIKRSLAEFLGSFFLCLVICLTAMSSHPEFTPFAAGFILLAMVYASGHISGAHFNPMVTIAVLLRGKIQLNMAPVYILSQCLGAGLAGVIAILLSANKQVTALDLSNIPLEAILAEFIGSFALAYVVLNVATAKNTQGNDYYGMAIGLTVCGLALALGGVSGGVFNPAVAIALGVSKLSMFSNLWIQWIGELLGGIMAALVFVFLNGKE